MTKKPVWAKDIKVLVWDLDGTLYNEITEIKDGIHKNAFEAISKAKNLTLKKAEKLFWKGYKKLNSSTQTLIWSGVDRNYALSGIWYSNVQLKYLKKDKQLEKNFIDESYDFWVNEFQPSLIWLMQTANNAWKNE